MNLTNSTSTTYYPIFNKTKEPLVIIDTVNSFFTYYYSALRIYNRSHHLDNNTPLCVNKTGKWWPLTKSEIKIFNNFLSIFEGLFNRAILKIKNVTNCYQRNIIFAIDCPRSEIWRSDILRDEKTNITSYKSTRTTRSDIGIPSTLKYLYDTLLPKYNYQRIGVSKAEADDIIGILTHFVNHYSPNRPVFIISDDSDFIQLLMYKNNNLYTQRLNNVRNKIKHSPRKLLEMKIIQGDRIDNIDSAFPKIGPKRSLNLINNPELFQKKIDKFGDEKLKRNRLLIDLSYIPNYIKGQVLEKVFILKTIL